MPAEECIRGADVAGRAKGVSSEKQTNNLSRRKGQGEEGRKHTRSQFPVNPTDPQPTLGRTRKHHHQSQAIWESQHPDFLTHNGIFTEGSPPSKPVTNRRVTHILAAALIFVP